MSYNSKLKILDTYSQLKFALIFSIVFIAIGTIYTALSHHFAMGIEYINNSSTSTTKPVDGYNTPQGHLSAIRHVFDDPSLRVQHYCKPNNKIVLVCQLYDSSSPNATLIGVEYIITADQYKSLPDREKPNWHAHKIEFATNRADPMFPEVPSAKANALMHKLMDTYGKVIITWNPKDKLPAFVPQIVQVQHPFMVNQTITPQMQIQSGTFNQTLKY